METIINGKTYHYMRQDSVLIFYEQFTKTYHHIDIETTQSTDEAIKDFLSCA